MDPDRDILATDVPTAHCPTCGETFLRPEDLPVHVERHRPVPKGEIENGVRCPRGCGRWLDPEDPEKHVHEALCDGSPPLKHTKGAYKWWCPEHRFGTDGPKVWGWHKKEHHEGKDPAKDKDACVSGDVVDKAISILRAEKSRLEKDLRRVDAALRAVEQSCEDGV